MELFKLTQMGRITGDRKRVAPVAKHIRGPALVEEIRIQPIYEASVEEDSLDMFMKDLHGIGKEVGNGATPVNTRSASTKITYHTRVRGLEIDIRATLCHYANLRRP